MIYKCVVIDDDEYAVDGLSKYISEMPDLYVYQTFTRSLGALSSIKISDQIDFIFLDIEMPELSGLELAASLRDKTKFLIFTTSHSAHALKAFDLNADQYLLKPFSFAKFALTINFLLKKNTIDLQNDLSKENIQVNKTNLKFIKADQKNAYHYIDPTEIVYIEAAKNYVIIYTKDEKYLTHMGLNHIETALDSNNFIRVNRSYIIAKNAIKKIAGNNIMLKNDKSIQLGSTYRTDFLEFMNKNMLTN